MSGTDRKNHVKLVFIIILLVNVLWFGFLLIQSRTGSEDRGSSRQTDDTTKRSDRLLFYKDQLSGEEQACYESLYQCIADREESVVLQGCSADSVERIYDAVVLDHPEIFWVNGFRYIEQQGTEPATEIRPGYCYASLDVKEREEQIRMAVKDALKDSDKDAKVFDKVRLAYDYIVNNTEYGENPNDQNMDSVLVGKKSVCMGYAKAMKYLLDQMGVRSFIVVGTAVNAQGEDTHAWNIIEADGAYFHADPTWGDPLFSGEEGNLDGYVNYAYLGCRDEQILKNHKEDPAWQYPAASTLKYNYFVVNDRYYDRYDAESLKKTIQEDLKENKRYLQFMFANENAYKEAAQNMAAIMREAGYPKEDVRSLPQDIMLVYTLSNE